MDFAPSSLVVIFFQGVPDGSYGAWRVIRSQSDDVILECQSLLSPSLSLWGNRVSYFYSKEEIADCVGNVKLRAVLG